MRAHTKEVGADAVLMTLAAESDEPIHNAAQMSRKRGRIILVGSAGLNLRRADFYEKELSFQVSCSYGPGRYDPGYEEQGSDYPLPYVRWTEQRNFEAVLELMANGRLDPTSLISHHFPIERAAVAYDLLLSDEPSLGILLTYPRSEEKIRALDQTLRVHGANEIKPGQLIAGIIGAGDFAIGTLIPAIQSAGISIRAIVSSQGLSAAVASKRLGVAIASSAPRTVFADPDIDTVFVLTRHNTHASLCVQALRSGKHVFVEKPLALSLEALESVRSELSGSGKLLTVGFNRRFAPHTTKLKSIVDKRIGPLSLVVTVNAGRVARDHWTQDQAQGGRIVGEACHFIDLARFLVGVPIADLTVRTAADRHGMPLHDVAHIVMGFDDGSTVAIHYLSSGSSRFPKERIEAFFDGKTASIDNWRRLRTWGFGRRTFPFKQRMDKGHEAEIRAFATAVEIGGPPPIPTDEVFEVSRWSIKAAELARGKALPSKQD